uniref:Uncharacterized protein n=1 Tax=Macaca mulatta TaxID=9544 RepID=A0A5F8AIY1_MACMU
SHLLRRLRIACLSPGVRGQPGQHNKAGLKKKKKKSKALNRCFFILFFFFFPRQGLTLSSRLACSGVITACCSLHLLGSTTPPISASLVAGTTGTHYTQLIFVFYIETKFHHVTQDTLEPPGLKKSACLSLP